MRGILGRWRRDSAPAAEQRLDGRIVCPARRSHLAPRALVGILVVPEADQLRAVAEAVPLHLVVTHLGDELVPDRGLLEPVGAPAVRFRETALGALVEQREDAGGDLLVVASADPRGTDLVDLALPPGKGGQ